MESEEDDPCAGYMIDDSDLEYSNCSDGSSGSEPDDDVEVKTKDLLRYFEQKTVYDSEDDFERRMDDEANRLVSKLMSSISADNSNKTDIKSSDSKEKKDEFYSEIYFDSSSDDETTKEPKKKSKVRKLTNDELLYDPKMDEEDEKWVQRQRMSYHNVRVSEKLTKQQQQQNLKEADNGTAKIPSSDAVLNCPACLSTLCLDCQKHDIYPGQFRAMFVLNCKIIKDEVLKYKPKPNRKKRKGKTIKQEEDPASDEYYKPVHCNICNTEVAVYDTDQVFHFFNVLPSQ